MSWLRGVHEVGDVLAVPEDVPVGTYHLDIAILAEYRISSHLELNVGPEIKTSWITTVPLLFE
jgi:hypothetical protein